ncbi:hypothetical protein DKM19_04040 [Streptosporangium sp. 'caverna']|nr:hypothetical protein DKM19_04040 [Streptosporangium sp. 'caverna']
MARHPDKEIRAAIDHLIAAGWIIEKAGGHAWGRASRPGGHRGRRPPTSIWSTPRSPEIHARRLRRLADRCPHGPEDDLSEGEWVS